ncbi:triphosphoribosyl-dephospho-CoA synthase [Geovibrio sp. ADMFC3]
MKNQSELLKNLSADLTHISDCLTAGAKAELDLTPKPGLVDAFDSGSHDDLSYAGMLLSVSLLPQYYQELAQEAINGADVAGLRRTGLEAEKRMIDICGSNAHKGYIFLSGLVLIACLSGGNLEDEIAKTARKFFAENLPESNGETARKTYSTGGIITECLNGMPSVFKHALPAMEDEYKKNGCTKRTRFAGLAEIMQTAEDTTALHRCGAKGLKIIKEDGKELAERLISDTHVEWLQKRNRFYKEIRLTMGGAADLLAIGCSVMLLNDSIEEFS